MQKTRHPRCCPACGGGGGAPSGIERDGFAIVRCQACGFSYLTPEPPQTAFTDEFAWEKSYAAEAGRRRREQPLLDGIDRATRWRLHLLPRLETRALLERRAEGGAVVDLGCGKGAHADRLPARYAPFGVEISPKLAREADARFRVRGGRCVNAAAKDGLKEFGEGFFSGAMLNSYLEHESRPLEVLGELRRTLKAGAPAVVKVPNFGSLNARVMGANWCGVRIPDHLNYFTFAALRRMAQDAGYAVESTPIMRLATSDNMWAILRRSA